MKISRHKGTEADQSHNYNMDVNRSEFRYLYNGLDLLVQDDSITQDDINTINKMLDAMGRYIEG